MEKSDVTTGPGKRSAVLLNVPNLLTMLRVILVPFYVVALLYDEHVLAFGLFVVASVTDLFDGLIARWTDQITRFGEILDPVADKLLLMSSFVLFAIFKWLPLWLVVTILSRDIIVVSGTIILYMTTGELTMEVNRVGKVATALQVVLLGYILVSVAFLGQVDRSLWLTIPVFAATIVSGIQYVLKGLRLAHVQA